jgi:hypothetical protein
MGALMARREVILRDLDEPEGCLGVCRRGHVHGSGLRSHCDCGARMLTQCPGCRTPLGVLGRDDGRAISVPSECCFCGERLLWRHEL